DLRIYRGERAEASYPMRAGHELSGEIVALGDNVATLAVGQRVGIEPLHLLGCGHCRPCLQGQYHICPERGLRNATVVHSSGFSELDLAPLASVYPLPRGVSFEEVALLDVYAVAVNGVHRVPVTPVDTVAVIGTGAVGLAQGQVARALGARRVIVVGRRAPPLALARACGAADATIDTSAVDPRQALLEETAGAGAEVVFETSGDASAVQLACELAAFGGRIGVTSLFAAPLSIDSGVAMRRELELTWVNSYSTWNGVREYAIALDLLTSGRVQATPLVTHRLPLDQVADGFRLANDKAGSGATKVMVTP
ncbi:MAG: zinc-binding dehydrogenase, partial [Chloroflexi bacterium]|nr:zinc-binding dehydrogenase [Chloroflexota bacterium]